MTALTELVDALVECTAPVTTMLDTMSFAFEADDFDTAVTLLRDILAPLGAVLAERDLRAATVVLEAAVPLIRENLSLLSPIAEAG